MMDKLAWLQWPAMAIVVIATWLTASLGKRRRAVGFWFLLAGNVLWAIWGWHERAYALILMQFALAVLNIRGVLNNE